MSFALYAIHGATPFADPAWQQRAAKYDIVVLNSWLGATWSGKDIRQVITDLKRLNPKIQVGIYTILEEAQNLATSTNSDIYDTITKNNWWYRDVNGNVVVTYPSSNSCAVKGTAWAEWLAQRNFDLYFNPATLASGETNPDFWFLDNVRSASTAGMPLADYRAMHAAHWAKIKSLSRLPLIGNAPNDLSAYPQQLEGSLCEKLMGANWSAYNGGWSQMMGQYRDHLRNTAAPHWVFFHVSLAVTDPLMLFAYCSCLLHDGYFAPQSTAADYYKNPVWLPEFDIRLGEPLTDARLHGDGKWRRHFERGVVTVDPTLKTGVIQ